MRTLLRRCMHRGILFAGLLISLSLLGVAALGQQPAERITAEINDNERTTIPGSHSPLARPENETGRMAGDVKLEGLSIVFRRTPEQEADLQVLIAAQHDPTSPWYHRWLSPKEFAARFGVADADIAKVQFWLEKRGFTVGEVSPSRNRITFSGTIEQVEASFGTEMHYYKVDGETHFSASRDISVPAALSSLVLTVTNLSSFHPRPHVRLRGPLPAVSPNFTSSQSGNHFLTPKDVATIYNVTSAYNAGFNGAGQSIAVVGQSDIVMTDIEHFQTAAGFTPVKDPVKILASTTNPGIKSRDEAESDLDLEYTSTIANGASIYFVFSSAGAFDALTYAVDHNTASIISVSYGICEIALGSTGYSGNNAVLAQAASQGQSVIAASGDSGSTDCSGTAGLTTAQQQELAVDFPASSQYVTGMGGTEFPVADVSGPNASLYWEPAPSKTVDLVSSAIQYIPEQVWNDDVAEGALDSGGGGVSTLTSRPSWQTGVQGIPSGTMRLVPDISLSSSNTIAPYLFCSSDTSTKVTGSCSNGFRDTNNTNLTAAGGTSFAAPIFAGMLAVINQAAGTAAQGVVNPTLYKLAANSSTAFHDITSGGNQCLLSSSTICSGAAVSEYIATTGYDEASGLGSIDFFNLLSAWPVSSKTTLVAATTTPAPGASDVITISVASAAPSSTTTATGTVSLTVDGSPQASPVALVNGSAAYSFSSSTTGSHTIAATYSGDSKYTASAGSVTVTVTGNQSSNTILSAAATTLAAGASDLVTITVASGSASSTATPTGSLTITVDNSLQTPTLTLANGSATYSFSSMTAGSHTISAAYSGDSIYAPSTGSVTVNVVAKSFKLAATSVTVASGSPGTSTVTITPQGGYAGTIAWTISSSPALTNGCFSLPTTTVSGTSAVTATLTVFTVASSCPAAAIASAAGSESIVRIGPPNPGNKLPTLSALQAMHLSMAMAGLLLLCLTIRRSRRFAVVAAICILVVMAVTVSGCGGGGGSSTSPPPTTSTPTAAKGTYTVTITGTDTVNSTITAPATITLTVD